jgi:hypothetical protein
MGSYFFTIPFEPKATDNHKYVSRDFRLSKIYSDFKNIIAKEMFKSNLTFKRAKVLVSFIVYKPTLRVDCHNFTKILCDGIKLYTARKELPKKLRVDDNWFSVNSDWVIDKQNPRIEIRISQGD